ncbi:transcription factor nrm1 whi5 [Stemphylium lycopersici]|uniref:Transcription factor nrm1 whi5 n=1 Tax=Stemphylium lycopersici TaxID=183478 RepID=A0A364N7X1_STELY|nr:transcription factor nrm1 whi5 [Stemphylium lycopersici]
MALRNFNPETFLEEWSEEKYSPLYNGKTLAQSIGEAFDIPPTDKYVYRAQAETTLLITQRAIEAKRQHGLHGWYLDDEGKPTEPAHPSPEEITAYTALFSPSSNPTKALTAFTSNAKSGTLRKTISTHLTSRYYVAPNTTTTTTLLPSSKKDRQHKNPYLDLWTYSSHELEWAGPVPSTTGTKISHHILPLFYHHFGCVVPSYAALHVLAKLAQPARPSKEAVRPILDIGSGNGYWTYMLRHFPVAQIGATKPLDLDWGYGEEGGEAVSQGE